MTSEELLMRLNNLYSMLESDGHYTKANTASFAADYIKKLEADNRRMRLEVIHANDTADLAIDQVRNLEDKLAKAMLIIEACGERTDRKQQ